MLINPLPRSVEFGQGRLAPFGRGLIKNEEWNRVAHYKYSAPLHRKVHIEQFHLVLCSTFDGCLRALVHLVLLLCAVYFSRGLWGSGVLIALIDV